MRERVAVVEDLAQLRFLLVGGDDLGLDGDRAPDQLRQHGARRVERSLGIGLDQVEDHRVGDETRLDDFGHARHKLVARQRFQRRDVDEHGGRLMERTDQVLARIGVDSGLAADRGVDHAEQGGGHVHDVDPTQPGGGGETGDVGGRSPAEADDGVLAANADAAQHLPDETRGRADLCPFRRPGSRFGVRRSPCPTVCSG